MKTATPVYCGIVCLYILVVSVLILPVLTFVGTYSLAAGSVPRINQACLVCSGEMASDDRELVPAKPTNQFMTKVLSANENSIRCQKAKSIITKYSFSDVQTKSCMGEVYQFVAIRKGEQFLIHINAFTRNLVEVAKVFSSSANLNRAENATRSK
jgi:hypothetical protein